MARKHCTRSETEVTLGEMHCLLQEIKKRKEEQWSVCRSFRVFILESEAHHKHRALRCAPCSRCLTSPVLLGLSMSDVSLSITWLKEAITKHMMSVRFALAYGKSCKDLLQQQKRDCRSIYT